MQVTETHSEGLKRAFTVVLPSDGIEQARQARLSEIGRTLRLPGFRPGKVPMPLVRQRYGTAVMAEVLEEQVGEAMRQLLSERGLRPAMQPKVDLPQVPEVGADLSFNLELEVLPEIAMPDFAAISLTRLKAEAQPETIDKALGEIASRQRSFEPIEEARPAEAGDFLTVDFVGRIDGEKFPGGEATGIDLEVAGPGFIPGFTEQLVGANVGETRMIDVTFPEDYQSKEVAGKAAQFEIAVKALKRAVTPAIDDELAKKIGFEGLDEIRQTISGQVQREYDQLTRLRLKRALLDALAEHASFEVPQGLVDAEFEQIWQRVEADRAAGRSDEGDAGKDEAALREEYRGIAERRVRLGLLLAEIGRSNAITVGNDEMTRAMRAEASRYPGQEAQVMEFFRKNPQAAENLRGPIFEDKVVDFVLELARVEDRQVPADELAREPEAA